MSFTVKIRGIDVTCSTIGELEGLLERVEGQAKQPCKAWKHPARPSWDAGPIIENAVRCVLPADHGGAHSSAADEAFLRAPNTVKIDPIPTGRISFASDVREAMGVERLNPDVEWTWEYALDKVRGLVVNRNMWQERAKDLNDQRERCDRRIKELELAVAVVASKPIQWPSGWPLNLNDDSACPVCGPPRMLCSIVPVGTEPKTAIRCQGVDDASDVRTHHADDHSRAQRAEITAIAADIIRKITKDNLLGGVEPWSSNVMHFVDAWSGLIQKEKAEIVTTWIDLVEAVLKANR